VKHAIKCFSPTPVDFPTQKKTRKRVALRTRQREFIEIQLAVKKLLLIFHLKKHSKDLWVKQKCRCNDSFPFAIYFMLAAFLHFGVKNQLRIIFPLEKKKAKATSAKE
jgi:hypothetical protein